MRGDAREAEHDPGEVMHCPHCLAVMPPAAHFCTLCGMPLTAHAMIGPMEQVWAFGWFINRLLSGRPSLLAVIGTWAIGLPGVLAVVGMVLAIVISPRSVVSTAGDLAFAGQAPAILVAVLYALLVVRVTYGYFRQDGAHTNTAHEG